MVIDLVNKAEKEIGAVWFEELCQGRESAT